jgi:hypothetical protein
MDEAAIYAMMADAKKQKPKQQGAAKKGKMSKTAVSEEERRNMVLLGVKKKKECEAKALNVVEKLADPGVDREWLRDAVCLSGSYGEIPIYIYKKKTFFFSAASCIPVTTRTQPRSGRAMNSAATRSATLPSARRQRPPRSTTSRPAIKGSTTSRSGRTFAVTSALRHPTF